MIDDWIDRFLGAGVELRNPSEEATLPLDFAVANERVTLCLLAGWWQVDWGQGKSGIEVVSAPLQEDGTFEGLNSELRLAGPSDQDVADLLARERLIADLNRDEYLAQLQMLREFEPDFDFNPWTEAIIARPRAETGGETGTREVGRIRFVVRGRLRDTLLIDEHGQATTTLDGGRLGLFAEQWSGYADAERPDVGAFLQWVSDQDMHTPDGVLEAPAVFSEAGPLDNLERAPAP